MIIEVETFSPLDNSQQRLQQFLDTCKEKMRVHRFYHNERQASEVWKMRDQIVPGCVERGFTLKYDVSLNSNNFNEVLESLRSFIGKISQFSAREKESFLVCGYGQVGDGNLHIRVIT